MTVLTSTLVMAAPWLALGVSIVSLGFSVHLARRSTHVTTYRNATDLALEIDKVFVSSPELRRFFFEGAHAARETEQVQRHVAAVAEFILDCLECIWDLRHTYEDDDRLSWRAFVWDMLTGSPPLAQVYWKHQPQGWYPALDNLSATVQREDARVNALRPGPHAGEPAGDASIFIPLAEAPTALVRDFYDGLLAPNFLPDELESFEALNRSIRAGACGTLAKDGGRIVGGVVTEAFHLAGVQLISYLVVDPTSRGHGLGRRLAERCAAASRLPLIVGEIEDPRYWTPTSTSDPVARMRFWERLGCRVLPLHYVQPRLDAQRDRVRHMLLIVIAGGGQGPATRVPGDLVLGFLRQYYRESEGREPDDPEYQALIEACSVDWLPLWPLARLDEAVPSTSPG